MKSVRIDNKKGKITGFVNRSKARIKLDGRKKEILFPVGMLKAPRGFSKLSSKKMKEIINKPHMGYKIGQRVTISGENPLYS